MVLTECSFSSNVIQICLTAKYPATANIWSGYYVVSETLNKINQIMDFISLKMCMNMGIVTSKTQI